VIDGNDPIFVPPIGLVDAAVSERQLAQLLSSDRYSLFGDNIPHQSNQKIPSNNHAKTMHPSDNELVAIRLMYMCLT
jgi:hypothetical protein